MNLLPNRRSFLKSSLAALSACSLHPFNLAAFQSKRIVKLHSKDFSRKKRDEEGLWAGLKVNLWEGDCDWPAMMQALDAIGFRGWGSAELAGGDHERLKDISDRMDRIYNC